MRSVLLIAVSAISCGEASAQSCLSFNDSMKHAHSILVETTKEMTSCMDDSGPKGGVERMMRGLDCTNAINGNEYMEKDLTCYVGYMKQTFSLSTEKAQQRDLIKWFETYKTFDAKKSPNVLP
jgi:hypothetical protein